MRCKSLLGMLWLTMATVLSALEPGDVAILYNSADPESKELAEFYAKARSVPVDNLIGLDMPKHPEINREQYNSRIAEPLREVFEKRDWWKLGRNPQGGTAPLRNKIRVLLTLRGVPLKIKMTPSPDGKPMPDRKTHPFKGHDEASVDSELALLGVSAYPLEGAQRNPYFKSRVPIAQTSLPSLMLTCRIDAPSLATCKRMINDAVEAEQSGLWGFHQIDISKKYPQGDEWLETVVKQNRMVGLPTAVDRFRQTLPTHYPLKDLACYYGWYDRNLSGPMLNPDFRFRRGAIAVHIHSFSAQQMRDPKKNWSAGLLEAGAAVTVGNVYEPYLALTHHLDVLHERLLDGNSWVEASWMAMPSASWQAITLGDPLYRPFNHINGSGKVLDADREYRALREAMKQWRRDPVERTTKLKDAAVRMKSGIFLEAIALESVEEGKTERAGTLFVQARELYTDKTDQLRQDLHRTAMMRTAGQKDIALRRLRELADTYADLSEVKAVQVWIDQLEPPKQPEKDQ